MSSLKDVKEELKRLSMEIEEIKRKIKAIEISDISIHDPLGVSNALKKYLGDKEGGIFVHAGYIKIGGWYSSWNQLFDLNHVNEVSSKRVERFVIPLANASRITLLKTLLGKSRTVSEIIEITGLKGGELYHHLKELIRYGYVTSERRGTYKLTTKGEIVLISICGMARWLEPPTDEEIAVSKS